MKQLILIFIFSASLIMGSCDGEKKTFSRYELINGSDYEVILKSFDRESQRLQKTIQLLNRDSKWESEKFQTSEPGGELLSPDHFLEGDSIRIEFDAEKVLIYIGTYSERNILYEENYELEMEDGTNTVRRYFFTQVDYSNAQDIAG